MPAISLDDFDDEEHLMVLLRAYCARSGKKATVYFDRRAPGSNDPPAKGGLSAHFITPPRTADEAIKAHLFRLGRGAKNWTVVSSDHEVRASAQLAGARSQTCRMFAIQMTGEAIPEEGDEKPQTPLSEDEIDRWEQRFRAVDKNE